MKLDLFHLEHQKDLTKLEGRARARNAILGALDKKKFDGLEKDILNEFDMLKRQLENSE